MTMMISTLLILILLLCYLIITSKGAPPTPIPTSLPSFDTSGFQGSPAYGFFYSNQQDQSHSGSTVFGTYFYKGQTFYGDCTDWTDFINIDLNPPVSGQPYFESINVTFSSYDDTLLANRQQILDAQCSNATTTNAIIRNLKAGLNVSLSCGGHKWRTFKCGSSVNLCIDCPGICGLASCPSNIFVFNPCSNCAVKKAMAGFIFTKFKRYSIYPTASNPVAINSSSNSITVALNMSSPGNLYCAPYAFEDIPNSLLEIKFKENSNFVASFGGGLVNLTLNGLTSVTKYTIYCYTEDFFFNKMPYEVMKSISVTASTLCCSHIQVTKSFPFLYIKDRYRNPPVFKFNLTPKPINSTLISLTALQLKNCSYKSLKQLPVLDGVVQPSSYLVGPDAPAELSFAVVSEKVLGCIAIEIKANGHYGSAVVYTSINNLPIPPRTPEVSSINILNDGTVGVFFDSETNQAGYLTGQVWQCSQRLQLTEDAYCKWTSPSLLIIMSKGLNVGDPIIIKQNGIKAATVPPPTLPDKYSYIPLSTYTIRSPTEKLYFTPVLSTPTVVNTCDQFEARTSAVVGNGGRPWKSVQWNATYADIQSELNKNFNTGSKIISSVIIDTSWFPQSGTYTTISLAVKNLLLQQSMVSARVKFTKNEGDLRVVILGSSQLIYYTNNVISIFASASVSICAIGVIKDVTPLISYKWVVYQDDIMVNPRIISNSKDPKNFRLDPNTLSGMATYKIQVVAQYTNNNGAVIAGSANVIVEVREAGVQVVIVGGSSLSFLTSKANIIKSKARDLAYPRQSQNLTYRWTCTLDIPNYGSSCPLINDVTSSNLALQASVFNPGAYLFSVLVTSLRGYTEFASVSVTFSNTVTPSNSIEQLKVKYNTNERVIITTQSDFAYDGALTWTTYSKDISSLQAIAITPVKFNCSAGLLTSQLVIAANTLLQGVSYKFHLDAKFNLYPGTSETTVLILMNTAPYGGTLSVTPKQGFALQDIFTLSSFSWTDDIEDFPLQYKFTYYTVTPDRASLLAPTSEQSKITALLGLGDFLNNYRGICSVTVLDIYSAGGISTVTVIVNEFSPLPQNSINDMKKLLLKASKEQDMVAVMQILSGALSLINYQDCVLPADLVKKKITCSTLFREECSNTAKTCGSCKPGYVGVFGDSNSACTSGSAAGVGQPCTRATDCATGVCSGFPLVCSAASKSCPNSCSGQGQCRFYDDGGNELSSCLVTDYFCEAVCVCLKTANGQQSYGKDCSINSLNDFITISGGRETICSTLASADLQNLSYDIFLSYVSIIADTIRDPLQLTDAGLATCTNVLVDDLRSKYPDYSIRSESANILVNTFASVLMKGSAFSTPSDSKTREAFLEVMTGIQENMALGQQPFQVVTSTVRSETSLNFVNDRFVQQFYIPRTPLEIKENVNISSISIVTRSSVSDLVGLGVTVTQSFQKNAADTSYVSNTLRLDLQGYAKSGQNARRQLTSTPVVDLSVTLTNPQSVTYFLKKSSYQVLYCQISAKPYDISFTCENGRILKHTCDGKKGTWTITCGKFASVPICKTWNPSSSSYIADGQCSVVSFSATQTQCFCSQKSLFQRKLIAQQNVYQFAVGKGIIYDDDIEEYVPILGYTPRIENQNSITYANGVIVVIFLIGAVFFLLWDFADGQARSQKIYEEMEKKIISKNNFKETLEEVRTIQSLLDKALPRDFKSDNWHDHFWNLMKKDYNFIALCTPEQFSGIFRSSNWILATWRYFPYVLGNTLLAYFLYSDDETCENTLNKEGCLTLKSSGNIRNLCNWRDDIQYCYYKDPDLSFYNVIMLSAAITVVSHFANKFLEFVCHRAGDIEVFDTIYREWGTKPDDSLDINVDDDDDDDARPPPVRLDEFSLVQTEKGKILRAAKLAKSQEIMDFVSPTEEKNLILTSKLYTEKRYHEILVAVLKDMGLVVPKDKLIAQTRIEKKILSSIREARRAAKQMVKEMNNMKEDEDREVFLLKNFLVDRFRGPRRTIAVRYLFTAPPLGAAQKYTLLLIGFICLILLPIIFALYLYVTWTYTKYIGTRAIPLWSQVLTVSILLDIFILQWFVIWIKASVVEAAFGVEMSRYDKFFRRLGRLILLRTGGLLREANAAVHHFNPACRTARVFPSLPVSRLLISLGDADLLPPKRGWIRERGLRAFIFMYSTLTMVPENVEDFVIELLTIICCYALCIALNSINWIFSVIIAVFVFIAFFGNEIYYYYDYKKRNYRSTEKDVNTFLKEEQMILQRKKKREAHNLSKSSWKPITNSIKKFSLLVTKRMQKVGIDNVEEEMMKKDENPVPLGTLTVDALTLSAANHQVSESKDNSDSVEDENDSVEVPSTPPIRYSVEQMKFAEKLKTPFKERVTGGPIQNKKSGVDQQLEIEKKQKENTIGQIYYDMLNDPRAAINESEQDIELVPFIKSIPALVSSTFIQYKEDDEESNSDPIDTKEKYFVQHSDTNRREPAIKRPDMARRFRVNENSDDNDPTYIDKYIYDESIGQYRSKTKDEISSEGLKRDGAPSRERRSRKHELRRKDKYEEKELTEDELHTHGSTKRRLRSTKKVDSLNGSRTSGPGAITKTEMTSLSGQHHEEISSNFLMLTKTDSEEIPYVDFCNFHDDDGGEHNQDEVLRRHGGQLFKGPGSLKIRPQTPPPPDDTNEEIEKEEVVMKDASDYKTVHDMEDHVYHKGIKVRHINYPTIVHDESED